MSKIIFLDIDGTLVDYENRLPDSAVTAIRRARANGHSYQDFLDGKEAFPDLQHGTWGGKDEEALFGDFGVKGITKANAVSRLLAYLDADISDTIAFGDAKIDIPMLEYCAYGVAMGNGGAEIKAMADMITDDVEQDGLYHAFEKLELI